MTSDEIERLRAELDQWRRLTDPQTLHAKQQVGGSSPSGQATCGP